MLLDLLLPQRCVVCRVPGDALCAPCAASLTRLEGPGCRRCGAPTAWPVDRCRECAGRRLGFATARAAVSYEDAAVRAVVHAWKERGLRGLAGAAAAVVCESLPRPDAEALVPIPPDRDRGLRRGYHPPRRLAAELGRRWRLPVTEVLTRTRPARRQRGLALSERRANVRGSFAVRSAARPSVVVVDDVYTTGSTAAEAAQALARGGARSISVITFARAIR